MNEANYASLTAGLLARKGQAKPAMRPQNYGFGTDDDLGWNDMGGADLLTPEQRIALMPAEPLSYAAPRQPAFEPEPVEAAPVAEPAPEPLVASPPQPIAVLPPVPRPRAAPGSKAKAAFTLRLDPERHMQLRLACVYGRKSAQQIVIAALDDYLAANFPDAAKGSRKATAN
jgi:hypothetical protein